MSLAEPRKRRKNPMHSVNLSAQNHWSEDDSKFGQRMLEKFGWSKGVGLGKNKQGIAENIKVQHKVTPTGLGFLANNADDWFKAGEDYSRLLSQLTEKFDQYQALTAENANKSSPKSLEKNSLNSKSRVHYHKFTKGKDLTQYKKEELACILGKGVKDDDHNLTGLNMQEYFNTKRESKKLLINKQDDTPSNEDPIIISDNEVSKIIPDKIDMDIKTENVNHSIIDAMDSEIKTEQTNDFTSPKKKKRESQLSKQTVEPANECNDVELKKKKKKSKESVDDNVNDVDTSKKKKRKSKTLTDENVDSVEYLESECTSNDDKESEEQEDLVLTHKYQNLVDLLIENSSAGKKYCTDPQSSLFEKRMKKFTNTVKNEWSTTVCSEIKPANEEPKLEKPIILNPDDKNFIRDFEAQKSKVLESIIKRQEVAKYVNEKSMFIAKHGDVLFFGSNLNDIKGYGDW